MSWLPSGHSLDHNLHRDPLISFYPQSVFTKSQNFSHYHDLGKILPSLASCRVCLVLVTLCGGGWFWWITDHWSVSGLHITQWAPLCAGHGPPPPSCVLINTQMRGYRDDVRWEWECEKPCLRSRLTVEAESRGLTWGGGSVHNDIDIHKLQSIKNNFISHDWKAW